VSITLLTEVSGPEFQLMHCPSRTLSPAVNENEGTLLARGTAGGSSMGFTTSEEEEESLRDIWRGERWERILPPPCAGVCLVSVFGEYVRIQRVEAFVSSNCICFHFQTVGSAIPILECHHRPILKSNCVMH